MTLNGTTSLFVTQVDMMRALIAQCRDMHRHLAVQVLPHLGASARLSVESLIDHLEDDDPTHSDLLVYLDTAIVDIREAIADGTIEERVPIPAERLIGTSEAYDMHKSLTPAAEALRTALSPMERLFTAVQDVQDFARAIHLTLNLIDRE